MSDQPETTVSWRAVGEHAPVITSDGTETGQVTEVAALPDEDIFHGVVFLHRDLGHEVLAPASDVERITDHAVYLSVPVDATRQYEKFEQLHVKRLGLRGIFNWKHVGWRDSEE